MELSYFYQSDALFLAKDLLGKSVFTLLDGQLAGGIIVETEAYCGTNDRASHAFGGRCTARNEMMFARGGVAYVYRCYGIHHLLNVVTNACHVPDAVLIRAIVPTHGEELMLKRTGKTRCTPALTNGPGKVCKALGITMLQNGISLNSNTLWIEDRGTVVPPAQIKTLPRIGVDYAGEDALLPWRFTWEK